MTGLELYEKYKAEREAKIKDVEHDALTELITESVEILISRKPAPKKKEKRVIGKMSKEDILEYKRKYRVQNSDNIAAYNKQYREKNKKKVKECTINWRKKNAEHVAQTQREWQLKNKEKLRLYMQKYRTNKKP